MKTGIGRLAVALVLFGLGAAGWAEARLTRRLAEAHQRFATFRYAADDGMDEAAISSGGLTGNLSTLRDEARQLQTDLAYWRAQGGLRPVAAASAAPGSAAAASEDDPVSSDAADADQMFAAANRAFRESQRQVGDRAVVVEGLDNVLQAYAEVIRTDAGHADAAFNYEFVARYRDVIARGRGPVGPGEGILLPAVAPASPDLPAGLTIHGQPGAPPDEVKGEDFKTLVPMPAEEVPEEAGEGAPRRRG